MKRFILVKKIKKFWPWNRLRFSVIHFLSVIPEQSTFYEIICGYIDQVKVQLKVFFALWLPAKIRYVLDLSNEILNIQFAQGAAKIWGIQVGDKKKLGLIRNQWTRLQLNGNFLFHFQISTKFDLWYFHIFAAPWPKWIFITRTSFNPIPHDLLERRYYMTLGQYDPELIIGLFFKLSSPNLHQT